MMNTPVIDKPLWQLIKETENQLDRCLATYRTNCEAFATAEKDYKVALRLEVLKLRDAGNPVTLIPLIVYGIEEIADLRWKRDVAEATAKANLEALNVKKLELRVLQSQYEREYDNER